MKKIAALTVLAWWVVFTTGLGHDFDRWVAGPYVYEDDCAQAAQYLNARGVPPWPYFPGMGYYVCEWSRE
jgi:hypothetical protein